MKTKYTIMSTLAAAALLLTGCASYGGSDSPVGSWGAEEGPGLTLEEGGSLTGHDGCNQMSGSWTQEGDTINFGDVATTLMACEGVDTWLNGLSTATVSGDTMSVMDQGGAEIGTLDRR